MPMADGRGRCFAAGAWPGALRIPILLGLAILAATVGQSGVPQPLAWPLWLAALVGSAGWGIGWWRCQPLLAWAGYYGAWMALAGLAVSGTGLLTSVWVGLYSLAAVMAAVEMPTLPAFLGLGTWGFMVNLYTYYATRRLDALMRPDFWVASALLGLVFGAAVQNVRTLQRLYHGMVTDPLTGVGNRRELDRALVAEWERARRTGRSVSLLLIDLDHFKQINDGLGHPAGDRVLKDFARLVVESVRSYDTVCRYGGDEFAVILPDSDTQEAVAVAERLRQRVQELVARSGIQAPVTISIGLASYPKHARTPEELIRAADVALLCEAKQGGRNRVAVASPAALAAT